VGVTREDAMGKLTATSFVSLDGVMQAPGGPSEDRSGGFAHGGWVIPLFDDALGGFMVEVFGRAGAFLLGRGTWQIFASHWRRVTDPADPIAGPLNRLPKFVASRTLQRADWAGSTIVRDVAGELERLKGTTPGELQVHGSPGLLQSLLREGLVDELDLITFPVVLGGGKRLFEGGAAPAAFELAGVRTTAKGVVAATYRRAGKPVYGDATLR
jgi:dihydrofolate reductase